MGKMFGIITILDCHANIIRSGCGGGRKSFLCEAPETETKFDGVSYLSLRSIRLMEHKIESMVECIIEQH